MPPTNIGRSFRTRNIEIDHDRFLPAADHYALYRRSWIGVDFLVRHKRRNVDEIARPGFVDEFQLLAPAESRAALHYIEDRFQLAMVVRARLGVGFDYHRSGPQLVRSGAGVIDGGLPIR